MAGIQVRRGLRADLPTLAVGEQGFCTDTNELYIGAAGGDQSILTNGRNLKAWWNFEDFIGSGTQFGGLWYPSVSGADAAVSDSVPTSLRPGICSLTTGTTNAGIARIGMAYNMAQRMVLGAGVYTIEADINITTLSTATEAYTLRFGFMNSGAVLPTEGVYFQYSNTGSTPNWYKSAAQDTTYTDTDTTIVAATGWTRLKLVVNAAATSVEYFINGVSAGVVTTNISIAAICPMYTIIKSAGTTARLFYIDWAWLHVDLAVSR